MARITETKTALINKIEVINKRITSVPNLTATEREIVSDAINNAIQTVVMDYKGEHLEYTRQDIEVTTTAYESNVDLTDYIFKIFEGTVRIEDERVTLSMVDEAAIFGNDPGLTVTGLPQSYALVGGDNLNTMSLFLYPKPDKEYTIKLSGLFMPEDEIEGNFPEYIIPAVQLKSYYLALLALGLPAQAHPYNMEYESKMLSIKETVGSDGPKYVPIIGYDGNRNGNIQQRARG